MIHYPQQCRHHHNIPLSQTLLYCLALSSFFVLSLYAFVPSSVRRLPRDHARHIRWRAGVVLGVATTAAGIYPLLFCESSILADIDPNDGFLLSTAKTTRTTTFPSWYAFLGMSWRPLQDLRTALHVCVLYLGSFGCVWWRTFHRARILQFQAEGGKVKRHSAAPSKGHQLRLPKFPERQHLFTSAISGCIRPAWRSFREIFGDEDRRWTIFRNLGAAPLAEEVVFRACLVPPLLASSGMTPVRASWIAPLFFGVAHLHHFFEQFRRLPSSRRTREALLRLSLGTTVQWAYTTLFGAYVSHVFVRTGSLGGVVLAHFICNFMGLPDISFVRKTSDLYGYRWFIATTYLVGIALFVKGFDSALFPKESAIPALLLQCTFQE